MDWSLSKIIRIERGLVGLSTSDLRALLQLYGTDDPRRVSDMVDWARASRSRAWWIPFRESLPTSAFESLLGLEEAADNILVFSSSIIPGLLQTPRYITGVMDGFPRTVLTEEAANIRAQVRLRRQEHVLGRGTAVQVVMDEAALRRKVGSDDVMAEQMSHLQQLSTVTNVSILILPFAAGPYVSSGSFTILSFADVEDDDAVYAETFDTDTIYEGSDEVSLYQRLYNWVRDRSLDRNASLELIKRVADEFA